MAWESKFPISQRVPPNKELILQALDEDFRAVHSMRSVAFVHKGEMLTCAGCHEPTHASPRVPAQTPKAMRRAPSVPATEPPGVEPITFARHVRPILQRYRFSCFTSTEYNDLLPVTFHFAGGFRGKITRPVHGGSRTIPGFYGARVSTLGNEAHALWKAGKMTESDYRTLSLWLDCHSLNLGAFHGEQAQKEGQLVWPRLDVVPEDPMGLEGQPGKNTIDRILGVAAQLHPGDRQAVNRWRCADPSGLLAPETPVAGPPAGDKQSPETSRHGE